MRDAGGVFAGSPLYAIRMRLVDMLRSRQVNFSSGHLHAFFDMKGLLGPENDKRFYKEHACAVEGFVRFCSQLYGEEAVRSAVAQAEAQFFSLRVNAIEEAKQGRTTHRTLITRETLTNVMVLLQQPTPAMVKRAVEEGMRAEMAYAFEIEGVFKLPDNDRARFINDMTKGLHLPPLEQHWAAMFNEVFEVARGMLNE
jgi:hypothetical protein